MADKHFAGRRWLLLMALAALAGALPLGADAAGGGAAACTSSATRPVRVLAVGDSLTVGAVPSLRQAHPYTNRLAEMLRAELPGRNIEIRLAGEQGYLACGGALDHQERVCRMTIPERRRFGMAGNSQAKPQTAPRRRSPPQTAAVSSSGTIVKARDEADGKEKNLQEVLQRELGGGTRYDIICLNGGINDLGRGGRSAYEVWGNLRSMIEAAARSADHAVVYVAPWANRFVGRDSKSEVERQQLLRELDNYFTSSGKRPGGPPMQLLDRIESAEFAFWNQSPEERSRYQDDALHLTRAGYDVLGAHLFRTLSDAGVITGMRCGPPPLGGSDSSGGTGGDNSGSNTKNTNNNSNNYGGGNPNKGGGNTNSSGSQTSGSNNGGSHSNGSNSSGSSSSAVLLSAAPKQPEPPAVAAVPVPALQQSAAPTRACMLSALWGAIALATILVW
jgi:lysophospholipase L1-like esterase